ncbi:MAG TPA: hypothetical protein VIQ76_03790 [Propionibacteriaceae bacterium]
MSDVDNAQTGAEVAAVDNTAVEQESQTQAQTPTTEQVDTTKDDKPRDDKGRFVPQERVNEITRARREAERRADALERELASVRQHIPAQHQPQSQDKPPSIADFNYDVDQWSSAMTQYAIVQAEARAEQKITTKTQQERQQEAQRSFEQRAVKYAADHPDFNDAVDDLSRTVRFPNELIEAISASEHGPAVVHHLAQHLDEADRLARMPPHLAAVQLGRIEERLSTLKPKPVTKAPDPTPTLGGGAAASKDPDRMSADEWLAWRNKQLNR